MTVKRTLDEPEIRELLSGLVHGNKQYYRATETGARVPVPVRAELMKLHMSHGTVSRVIREAISAGLITEAAAKKPVEANDQFPPKQREVATDDDDEEQDEPEECTSRHSRSPLGLGDIQPSQLRRYQLVKSGDWYGFWDDEFEYQELVSKDKEETLERIYELQRHGSGESCVPLMLGRFNT